MVRLETKPATQSGCTSSHNLRSCELPPGIKGCRDKRRPSRRLDEQEIQNGLHEYGTWRQDLLESHAEPTDRKCNAMARHKAGSCEFSCGLGPQSQPSGDRSEPENAEGLRSQ